MTDIIVKRISESSERLAVASLLYRRDKKFVPITPLSVLRESTTFFKAVIEGTGEINAASSYEEWLQGCDAADGTGPTTSVYELATSIVGEGMGGFNNPTLQQIFAFVRLTDILFPYIPPGQSEGETISVIAAIAAQNTRSLAGMKGIGMLPIDPLPRWLEYEHRSWFTKLDDKERVISDEAHYLWLPPDAARDIFRALAPVADATQPLSRPLLTDKSKIEQFVVKIAFTEFLDIKERFGSFVAACDHIPFDVFRPPPKYARLSGGVF